MFFSREERRLHIHVASTDGEAKFWITPEVMLAKNYGFSKSQIAQLTRIIEERKNEIENAWKKHFSR